MAPFQANQASVDKAQPLEQKDVALGAERERGHDIVRRGQPLEAQQLEGDLRTLCMHLFLERLPQGGVQRRIDSPLCDEGAISNLSDDHALENQPGQRVPDGRAGRLEGTGEFRFRRQPIAWLQRSGRYLRAKVLLNPEIERNE